MAKTLDDSVPIRPESRVLLWLAVPVVEIWIARGTWTVLPLSAMAWELGGFALFGLAQDRFARGWWRSLWWPGAVALGLAALLGHPPGFAGAVYAIGVFAAVAGCVRVLHGLGRPPVAAPAILAILAPVLGRVWLAGTVDAATEENAPGTAAGPLSAAEEAVFAPIARMRRPTGTDGPPVVLITIDTLRADAGVTMPSFQRLARRGASWDRAISASCWTLPSLAAVQTGLTPAGSGADMGADGRVQGLSPGIPTLAEQLRGRGYATAASVANPWASTALGLRRGFTTWISANETLPPIFLLQGMVGTPPIDGDAVVDRALQWLAVAPDRGFFLWVHLLDPHMPYGHAAPPLAGLTDAALRSTSPSPARKDAVRAAYAVEVSHADEAVGRLLDALEARGILDDGVVILTADHGEELWDHGSNGHGFTHHAEVTEIPLVVVAPGLSPGPRSGTASLVDLAPTIRAAAGLPPDGIDLREPIPAGRIATSYGALYGPPLRSAVDEDRRVIVSGDPPVAVAYDRRQDPTDQHPLPADDADPVAIAARGVQAPAAGDAQAVDVQALKALGYVQ
jgi:arylsulfatase